MLDPISFAEHDETPTLAFVRVDSLDQACKTATRPRVSNQRGHVGAQSDQHPSFAFGEVAVLAVERETRGVGRAQPEHSPEASDDFELAPPRGPGLERRRSSHVVGPRPELGEPRDRAGRIAPPVSGVRRVAPLARARNIGVRLGGPGVKLGVGREPGSHDRGSLVEELRREGLTPFDRLSVAHEGQQAFGVSRPQLRHHASRRRFAELRIDA